MSSADANEAEAGK